MLLFGGPSVGGRVPVPGADGGAQQQRSQRRRRWRHGKTGCGGGGRGGRGQEVRVGRQEVAVSAGQGTEGVHHAGHHHERVHRVLAAVLRSGAGQTVPQRTVQHTQLAEQPVPVAGLRQLAAEPRKYHPAGDTRVYVYFIRRNIYIYDTAESAYVVHYTMKPHAPYAGRTLLGKLYYHFK